MRTEDAGHYLNLALTRVLHQQNRKHKLVVLRELTFDTIHAIPMVPGIEQLLSKLLSYMKPLEIKKH